MNDGTSHEFLEADICHDSAVPYRAYHCARCSKWIPICVHCDRGQKYCKQCASIAKKERIAKARKRYRVSERGKLKRREQALRRRARKKIPKKKVGDRPSPPAHSANKGVPLANEPEKGSLDEDSSETCRVPQISRTYQRSNEPVVCHFCSGPCASFQRSGENSWRDEKRNWEEKILQLERQRGSG